MPTCATRRDGVIGPHAHGSAGRQVVDDQDNTRRGGALGPHAHGNAARHVVDATPVCQLLGSANAETTPQGTPAAAAVRKHSPDAAPAGKNG